ncbi:MAG: hypothetical protein IPG23_11430 [Burkholderiales bacterium]|nr:hypothetical protein [Burkholderiales bacterium]
MKLNLPKSANGGKLAEVKDSGAKSVLNVTLSNSDSVPAPLYDEVKALINQNSSEFGYFKVLVPEDLIGIERWSEYSDGEKRAAEACVEHLYQTGQLPSPLRDFGLEIRKSYVLRHNGV